MQQPTAVAHEAAHMVRHRSQRRIWLGSEQDCDASTLKQTQQAVRLRNADSAEALIQHCKGRVLMQDPCHRQPLLLSGGQHLCAPLSFSFISDQER